MREIKFRGQHAGNLRWYYGGYHKHEVVTVCPLDNTPIEYQHLIVQSGFSDWNLPKPIQAVEVIPETVGQFTGLLDGNGKEIYEGDILQFEEYPPAQVLWYDGAFNARRLDINDDYILADWYDGTVIIGNIHDNPELAEGIEL